MSMQKKSLALSEYLTPKVQKPFTLNEDYTNPDHYNTLILQSFRKSSVSNVINTDGK